MTAPGVVPADEEARLGADMDALRRSSTSALPTAQLVGSKRTVDPHVINIFDRLSLACRVQVAAWVAEHRLLAPASR